MKDQYRKSGITAAFIALVILISGATAENVYAEKAETKLELQQETQVNINQADSEELQKIKGIGPALAGRIIAHRESKGLFKSVDDLSEVKGIGDAKMAKMKAALTV